MRRANESECDSERPDTIVGQVSGRSSGVAKHLSKIQWNNVAYMAMTFHLHCPNQRRAVVEGEHGEILHRGCRRTFHAAFPNRIRKRSHKKSEIHSSVVYFGNLMKSADQFGFWLNQRITKDQILPRQSVWEATYNDIGRLVKVRTFVGPSCIATIREFTYAGDTKKLTTTTITAVSDCDLTIGDHNKP